MNEISKYDAFLSYNSLDSTTVDQIAKQLQDRGVKVFFDRWYLVVNSVDSDPVVPGDVDPTLFVGEEQ